MEEDTSLIQVISTEHQPVTTNQVVTHQTKPTIRPLFVKKTLQVTQDKPQAIGSGTLQTT